MPAAKPTLKDPNHPLRKLGRTLAQAGLTTLGASVGGPVGAMVARELGDALGLPGKLTQEKLNHEIEKELATNPDALIALRQIEADTIRERMEHEVALTQSDTDRIVAVNETIRAEAAAVLTNPEAGAWRPLWGRLTAYHFFPVLYLQIGLAAWAVAKSDIGLLTSLITVYGVINGAFLLPAAILGVASYKRGEEKKILAGGLSDQIKG